MDKEHREAECLVSARQVYDVIVLDQNGEQLRPCRPARARILLKNGKARVISTKPFKIQMVDSGKEEAVGFDQGSEGSTG